MKEDLIKLIEKARENNTFHLPNKQKWTVPDNQITISISDLKQILL